MRAVRSLLALVAVTAFLVPSAARAAEVPCSNHTDPRLAGMSDTGIGLTSELGLADGRYALPASLNPTSLVVMFHGHGNDSCSWRNHLRNAATHGAIAVAMDYTGQTQTPVENYGWFVREGAEDSITAAKHFMTQYPTITKVIAFGISMGGNAAGMAVASPNAVRGDGSPLFDYLIDVEGVNNLIEEYLIARAIAPVNSTGALAQEEIEKEAGGSFEEVPEEYIELTNVARAGDMKGLDGAIVVHGLDDGLVPTDQTPQMFAALTLAGVKTHQHTVVLRGDGESGTTGTAIVAGPLFEAGGEEYESPFAGHGWEGSDTQLVIKTGFEQLWALLAGGPVETGVTVVPGA